MGDQEWMGHLTVQHGAMRQEAIGEWGNGTRDMENSVSILHTRYNIFTRT